MLSNHHFPTPLDNILKLAFPEALTHSEYLATLELMNNWLPDEMLIKLFAGLTDMQDEVIIEDLEGIRDGAEINETLSDKIRQKLSGAGFFHWLGYFQRAEENDC